MIIRLLRFIKGTDNRQPAELTEGHSCTILLHMCSIVCTRRGNVSTRPFCALFV